MICRVDYIRTRTIVINSVLLLYPPKERISLMISLISKKSAFYETLIVTARKYEFGEYAKINGAKIGGTRKKMGLSNPNVPLFMSLFGRSSPVNSKTCVTVVTLRV